MKSVESHPDRLKALQADLSQIEKQFGKGTVMVMGQQPTKVIDVILASGYLADSTLLKVLKRISILVPQIRLGTVYGQKYQQDC